jgi:predicted subunit of tRNA(5-methylaminomethyl-2-thiouridylate) methyltransferase
MLWNTTRLTALRTVNSTGKISTFIAFIFLSLGLNDSMVLTLFGIFRKCEYVFGHKAKQTTFASLYIWYKRSYTGDTVEHRVMENS